MTTTKSVGEWHALVADLLPRPEFDRRVADLAANFGDLLTPEVAAQLLVDQLGRNPTPSIRLGDLAPGLEGVVAGTCAATVEIRSFQRRDGGEGRLAKVRLRDATGECDLLLWGEHAERFAPKMREGVRVRVLNAYVKATKDGRAAGAGGSGASSGAEGRRVGYEVHMGRWGVLEFPDAAPGDEARRKLGGDIQGGPAAAAAASSPAPTAPPPPPPKMQSLTLSEAARAPLGETVTLTGKLVARDPTRTFFRDGKVGFVADIVLDDGTASVAVTLWGDRTREAQKLDLGSRVVVRDAHVRAARSGAGVDFHAGERARLGPA
jgi:replication factor A1